MSMPAKANQVSMQNGLLASLLVLAWMVEARDPYTGGHLWRVARMAEVLARAAGMDEREAKRIAMAGFLHDIGKISVPDAILRKPGRLDDDEFAVIKTHPVVGAQLLARHPLSQLVADVAHYHHEMPSGRGYPLGLQNDAIPLDARLVGICDAFDAMTSNRPYRKGMPIGKALAIIESELGQQFDAELGRLFVQIGQHGAFDHIVGHSDEGIPLAECVGCGPILQRYRHTQAGDHIDCPACAASYQWQGEGESMQLQLLPQGHGALAARQPDQDLLDALIEAWSSALEPLN